VAPGGGGDLLGLHGLRSLCQTFHLETLGRLEELRELVLGHVDLPGVHELQDGRQVLEGNVLQDDDGMLGWVLLQQSLEVGATGGQNHLVCLAALSIAGNSHVSEGLFIPEMFEGGDHVGLEVVPSEAELLLIINHGEARIYQLVLL